MKNINEGIESLAGIKSNLFGKDFLLTWEKSDNDLRTILGVAEVLREMRKQNISPRVFDSGLAISNFRDNSTRTRFSFASAFATGVATLTTLFEKLNDEKSESNNPVPPSESALVDVTPNLKIVSEASRFAKVV